jgi:hypothetical protein
LEETKNTWQVKVPYTAEYKGKKVDIRKPLADLLLGPVFTEMSNSGLLAIENDAVLERKQSVVDAYTISLKRIVAHASFVKFDTDGVVLEVTNNDGVDIDPATVRFANPVCKMLKGNKIESLQMIHIVAKVK